MTRLKRGGSCAYDILRRKKEREGNTREKKRIVPS